MAGSRRLAHRLGKLKLEHCVPPALGLAAVVGFDLVCPLLSGAGWLADWVPLVAVSVTPTAVCVVMLDYDFWHAVGDG